MASAELTKLIAAKRSNPYTAEKTVADLRREADSRIDDSILPSATHYESVDANGVSCEWIQTPGAMTDKVFYFIHGGGYYRGTVASSRSPAAEIARACGVRVLSVDYRLAPEHPFPAAVDDVVCAYQWLLDQGIANDKIVVGGISAGGGLTGALLLALKASGAPMPAGAVPMSPWMDMTQGAETYASKAALDPSISKEYLDRMAALYVPDGNVRQPLASPNFGDLSGLPPQLVQVGSAEVLLDDSIEYTRRAALANSRVTLEIWDDLIHGWHGSPQLPETHQAIRQIARFFADVTD
jgi:epsilon-lactone hydrolase